ncbi:MULTISPECIES: MFS transporter [unclassified Streptomyces]|uniref:MFS transporter n=1 Tax=unclassified Streptomyces TaxID=2593676 RepID=UPI00081E1310|nr:MULTISPECIES: MFS transporter [unclassified Streptomyces]MYR26503.1 MFS transporter [Streptomyces sp. SID4945]SCF04727.1 MFS transporter, DHA2 family, methylenomycin A resistance protein [Streptomyces sp. LcepLS]
MTTPTGNQLPPAATPSAPSPAPATGPATAPAPRPAARPAVALVAALLGFSLTSFDASAVTVSLPSLGEDLGGGIAGAQWVVDAYTLAFAGLMLSSGLLADRFGAARTYGAGLAAFVVTSTLCGFAPSLGWLLAGRVAQGAAAAVILPSSLALVRRAYSRPEARVRALAVWATGGSVAVALAPVLGGALTTAWGWRGIFFATLPLGLAALALLARADRPAEPVVRGRRPDLAGQLTAVLAVTALSVAVIEHGAVRWVAAGLAVLGALGFVRAERRTAEPAVPLALLRGRAVATALLAGSAASTGFFGLVFLYSLFFQQAQGNSALETGLLFLPMTSLIAATNVVSGRLTARYGARRPMLAGQVLATAGSLFLLLATGPGTSSVALAFALVPLALGCALTVPALTTLMMEAVPAARAGVAAGVLNAARQNMAGLATAVFGSLVAGGFASGTRASLAVTAVVFAGAALATYRLPKTDTHGTVPAPAGRS